MKIARQVCVELEARLHVRAKTHGDILVAAAAKADEIWPTADELAKAGVVDTEEYAGLDEEHKKAKLAAWLTKLSSLEYKPQAEHRGIHPRVTIDALEEQEGAVLAH